MYTVVLWSAWNGESGSHQAQLEPNRSSQPLKFAASPPIRGTSDAKIRRNFSKFLAAHKRDSSPPFLTREFSILFITFIHLSIP